LKPPFKCPTGAKDLQANIISIIVFVSGGHQFIFGFGLLISDFFGFCKVTLFSFQNTAFFQRLSSSFGMFFLLPLLFVSILHLP